MYRSKIILIGIAILFFLQGCAISPNFTQNYANIKEKKIAIAIIVPNKEITYHNSNYAVLYAQDNFKSSSFEGIWNPNQTLTEAITKSFVQNGFDASALNHILGNDSFDEYEAQITNLYHENSPMPEKRHSGVKMGPDLDKFKVDLHSNDMMIKLKELGYDYYIEILVSGFWFGAMHSDFVAFTTTKEVDLTSNSIVRLDLQQYANRTKLPSDKKELESNNLALIKQGITSIFTMSKP